MDCIGLFLWKPQSSHAQASPSSKALNSTYTILTADMESSKFVFEADLRFCPFSVCTLMREKLPWYLLLFTPFSKKRGFSFLDFTPSNDSYFLLCNPPPFSKSLPQRILRLPQGLAESMHRLMNYLESSSQLCILLLRTTHKILSFDS